MKDISEINSNAAKFWDKLAANTVDEKTPKINPLNDHTKYDADFIMKFANINTDILDLGSGSGLTINRIYNNVNQIVAVELYPEFSNFITKTDKIKIIKDDITNFCTDQQFDMITMFGIIQFFDRETTRRIYKKYLDYLKYDGLLIVKNQFGIHEDVIVSGYSEELKEDYHSQYRHIDSEVKLLEEIGFKNIEIHDIYPPECNRWDNTHFYAITAKKLKNEFHT